MSIFRGGNPGAAWGRCKRCGKPFIIRKEGQLYGRICGRKIAAQQIVESVSKLALATMVGLI